MRSIIKFYAGLVLAVLLTCTTLAVASNTSSYFTQNKRIGEIISLPWNGDSFTSSDGTVWKATNSNLLAYDSSYSTLLTDAPDMVTNQTYLASPYADGLWAGRPPVVVVGSSSGGATWLAPIRNITNVKTDFFYTSTNAGVNWTQRTPPVAAKNWVAGFDGTNFVVYAASTAGTGVQESTDAITWTSRTAISIAAPQDLIYAPSINTWLVCAKDNSVCATSTDRTTWTTRTPGNTNTCEPYTSGCPGQGMGYVAWNPGAGLFTMNSSTAGSYQTSPDGATWTTRTFSNPNFVMGQAAQSGNSYLFASNSTTTVAISMGGAFAYSTDCINWTFGHVDTSINSYSVNTSSAWGTVGGALPTAIPSVGLYWDGTRFVALFEGFTYYSTNGSSWTKATRGTTISKINMTITSGHGYIFKIPTGHAIFMSQRVLQQTDVTSTATTNIVYPSPNLDGNPRTYVRIK